MIKVSADSNSNSTPAPSGTHFARCYQIIDLGTHTREFSGKSKRLRELRISWELPTELHVFNEEKGEQPFTVHKTYTMSLHEKANLRHHLESWRGRPFSEQELSGFDMSNVLGAPCLVTVVHAEKNGKTYANIASVTSLPKGMAKHEAINPKVEYSLDQHDQKVFDALPSFMQEIIKTSEEWKHATEPPEPEPESDPEPDNSAEDDIPF